MKKILGRKRTNKKTMKEQNDEEKERIGRREIEEKNY